MGKFVHLHVHTEYSLLDGAIRIKDLVKKVKKLGMTSVAITDHGAMYGVIEFYKECKNQGIKPIIGAELYLAPRKITDKNFKLDRELSHIILLAKNNEGYQNLVKLTSIAHTEGFYYKPRIDMEVLKKYSKGLICTTSCLAGNVPKALLNKDEEKAKLLIEEYIKIFGKEDLYIELQRNKIKEQEQVNQKLKNIAKEYQLQMIATTDAHYLNKEDAHIHEILLCIQTGSNIEDPKRMKFETEEFYIKTEEEMIEDFKDIPEAIENTSKIANKCNVEIEFGKTHLPSFEAPDNKDNLEYLKEICYKGAEDRYGKDINQEIKDRIKYEIEVINNMGYVNYFLIVHDFINYSKEQKIPVGPGRGSAAGSIVAYCMKITDIDPLKYGLIFERFLNSKRITMPDIDVDFCYERRHEVINYVIEKYGKDKVAQIITFGTLSAKAVIRDVARVLKMPYVNADKIAKLIPNELGITLEKALSENKILKNLYDTDDKVKELINISLKLEGMVRHASIHAAGVVICDKPINEYVPLYKNDDGITTTQFTMTTLEELGLLKMDFLGLKTLTVINDAEKSIKYTKNQKKKILYPLTAVKNIGETAVLSIIKAREEKGEFENFEDFLNKVNLMSVNKKSIESLIEAGAFDKIENREKLLKNYENMVNTKQLEQRLKMQGQTSLFIKTNSIKQDINNKVKKDEENNTKVKIDINVNDELPYKLIASGKTIGIFQLESQGITKLMKELKPSCLEDIIAGLALYRPGPMDSIPKYIRNKNNKKQIKYLHPKLEPILSLTYGCIIYQEQVMQIVQELAGYSLGRADILRRAMSKKKEDVMQEERKNFIYGIEEDGKVIVQGCIKNGISEEIANKIFDEMVEFAKYAFNKSHATAYAYLSYQTAWLKTYYPAEYLASLMNSCINLPEKIKNYIIEAKTLGISTDKIDINKSNEKFTVVLEEEQNCKKLYIKLISEDKNKIKEILNILQTSKGKNEVYIYINDKNQNNKLNPKYWVTVNKDLTDNLKKVLGDENVLVI